jgi:hypothetical protein
MVTNAMVLKELKNTEFPKNTGSKNNLNKGQTYSLSMVLGQTMKMYCSKEKDPQKCIRPSRHNKKFPILLDLAKKFLKTNVPRYAFHSRTGITATRTEGGTARGGFVTCRSQAATGRWRASAGRRSCRRHRACLPRCPGRLRDDRRRAARQGREDDIAPHVRAGPSSLHNEASPDRVA